MQNDIHTRSFYRVLPTLAPDFSGVCSALFELGGNVIIHDAGGCTGTYTGYDEPRWFDQKSRIFTSNLDDTEAVFGDDDILLNKALSADQFTDGAFFALLGSPSPAVLGTDYRALVRLIEAKTGKRGLSFSTTGMQFYDRGIEMALLEIARKLLPPERLEICPDSVNLIGATPLDFIGRTQIDGLKAMLEADGLTVRSCWSMGSDLSEIQASTSACLNVALSVSAVAACRYLEDTYGMPFVVQKLSGIRPFEQCLEKIRAIIRAKGKSATPMPAARRPAPAVRALPFRTALVVGEQFTANAIRESLMLDFGLDDVDVCSFFSLDAAYAGERDRGLISEHALQVLLAGRRHDLIVADPLLRELAPEEEPPAWIDLPHVAMSSRFSWQSEISPFGADWIRHVQESVDSLGVTPW